MSNVPSQLQLFTEYTASRHNVFFDGYQALHQWCCDHPVEFWGDWLACSAIPHNGSTAPVITGSGFIDRQFFPELTLNYTRCLLQVNDVSDDHPAVSIADESGRLVSVTRGELREMVLSIAAWLRHSGVQPGDRIVAIAHNSIESIAACLGCLSIGAVWSSVSPELGVTAVLERFRQLAPAVVFSNTQYQLNGSRHSMVSNLQSVIEQMPSLEHLILLDEAVEAVDVEVATHRLDDLLEQAALSLDNLVDFPFDHPLFIMFSSGTTGKPKCIVHGAGGTLLEHLKEHRLHGDLSSADTLLFQTSTGWMMWNWQLSALASGTHIVLYDGSVSYPQKSRLLTVLNDLNVTVFGTSPAYIQFLIESGIEPESVGSFSSLRAIQSTGSVLFESQFEWLAQHFRNIPVQSVSGGTDMIGCLVLGHPDLPVRTGDSQCLSLGIDVRVLNEHGIGRDGTGELVVVKPFPSQPVYYWNDSDGQRLSASYFEANPGCWTHGDQIRITNDGSPRILGRSDGTLNVRGVRIGPAEIMTVVNRIKGVRESMIVEQASPREPGGSRLVLLLVMQSEVPFERNFVLQLKKQVATETSRLHVPSIVVKVPALPRTHNGKPSEKAARDAVNRVNVTNRSALVNPGILEQIAQLVPEAPG